MEVFLLSRIQFGLTIMFHYIFPPLSIGLGAIVVIMEGTHLPTGNVIYHQMTKFWSRVFAVNFAMGVAAGQLNSRAPPPMHYPDGMGCARRAVVGFVDMQG